MIVFGWAAVALGTVLFLAALTWTLRANPAGRIPFYRNAEVVPVSTVTMRAVGAGLLVFGAVALTAATGSWAVLIVLVAPFVSLTAIVIHNRSVARRSAADDATVEEAADMHRSESDMESLRPPLITTFDGGNWVPTSWGALVLVAVLAVIAGVVVSWLS